jgi:hypothetical protein
MTGALLKPIELPEAEVASDPYHRAAQNSFEFFRYLMRPQLITGWWVEEVCMPCRISTTIWFCGGGLCSCGLVFAKDANLASFALVAGFR